MNSSIDLEENIKFLRNKIAVLECNYAKVKSRQLLDTAQYRIEILKASSSAEELMPCITRMENSVSEALQQLSAHEDVLKKTKQECANLTAQIGILKNAAADAEKHNADLEEQVESLKNAVADAEKHNAGLEEQIKEVCHERDLMKNSTSWKVTKPFRGITDCLRRLIKKSLPDRSVLDFKKHPFIAFFLLLRAHKIFKFLCPQLYFSVKNRFLHNNLNASSTSYSSAAWQIEDAHCNHHPLVTIIVPNYNHAKFLPQRLDSIYNQTYRNFEVLLLDDVSSDNSVEILRDYFNRYPANSKLLLNEQNSGSPFAQWRKGIECARGELIWIAESDDWCDLDFLEKLISQFRIPSVMLAFARSVFMKNGEQVWDIESYLCDNLFTTKFVMPANQCVKDYFSIKNIIPNVSSCIFRKPSSLQLFQDESWNKMKVCGDWIFYLHLIKGGAIAYTAETTNYYRQHENNTSVAQQSRDLYYKEHQIVREQLAENYLIPEKSQQCFIDSMKAFWLENRSDYSDKAFYDIFDENRVREKAAERKPAIAMLCFAFSTGGGEKVPIILANAMKRAGYPITFINCQGTADNANVRTFLASDIPVINLGWAWDNFSSILQEFGIECIHSHHASVDFAAAVNTPPHIAQVVTTHGMYETVPEEYIVDNLNVLIPRVNLWLYIADKNLDTIKKYSEVNHNFRKTFNAVIPPEKITPSEEIRKQLGIGTDDFMITVISRGLPEKGWQEALDAVNLARRETTRNLKLVFVGDGPEYERMSKEKCDFAKFVGFSQDVYSYFAAADLAVLPSRFKGESFPLVILEAFAVDTPVIATDIGEFRNMLATPEGFAGEIVSLHNWQLNINELKDAILRFVDDDDFRKQKEECVKIAKSRFSIDNLVKEHGKFYDIAISSTKAPDSSCDA